MFRQFESNRSIEDETDVSSARGLRPDLTTLFALTLSVAAVSALTLPWQAAVASTTLGALMIAGADVDARSHLLPDMVTYGTIICGLLAAAALDTATPMLNLGHAVARAFAVAVTIGALRWLYGYWRGYEGLGFGDVKLAAGIGAWLPVDLIPLCFGIATAGALVAVALARLRGPVSKTMKIPLGAFLCPALWLVFYGFELGEPDTLLFH